MRQKSSNKRSRYSQKVPCRYDRDSASFNQGAWRHWPENRMGVAARKMEAIDRGILKYGRENR